MTRAPKRKKRDPDSRARARAARALTTAFVPVLLYTKLARLLVALLHVKDEQQRDEEPG